MTTLQEIYELRRYLLKRDVDIQKLPPFALSPLHAFELRQVDCVARENIDVKGPPDVFTVRGLRFVESDKLIPQGEHDAN